jgi:hypothetical protein
MGMGAPMQVLHQRAWDLEYKKRKGETQWPSGLNPCIRFTLLV